MKKLTLVINSGSTSIKYALFKDKEKMCWGIADRIGFQRPFITINLTENRETKIWESFNNHREALSKIFQVLIRQGIIRDLSEVGAVGHRVVHGGSMRRSTKINSKVIKLIRRYSKMAPLHNPANLAGIEACSKLIPEAEQVAVFDTAFHSDIPERARIYPIPIKYYRQGIMRYGFHGISHEYACMRAAQILRRDIQKMKIISCHLGGGSSVSAVLNGRCIDTSMGFTPLEGLMMATRSGDIDPGIILHLLKKGVKEEQLDEMLNKKSGFLGIMESSSDFRDILAGMRRKNKKAILAFEIFAYRISKYIGAYAAALNGVDAIVFTGGIGQNSGLLREAVLKNLEFLGVKLDGAKNLRNEQLVSAKGSRVAVVVVKADEEQMIAEETERVLKKDNF